VPGQRNGFGGGRAAVGERAVCAGQVPGGDPPPDLVRSSSRLVWGFLSQKGVVTQDTSADSLCC
jgi:hypothetical protein